jgi:hypothetical protein
MKGENPESGFCGPDFQTKMSAGEVFQTIKKAFDFN